MSQKKTNDDRRRETRYQVASSRSIRTTISRSVDEREETVRGQLLDLSQSGAKLLVPACLQFSEAISLKMTIPNLGLNIDARSQVCWIRPAPDNQWLIGCSFTPKISEEALGQLASAGIVERRDHPRHPVEMMATARWESEQEPFPVVLRDYSANGFCMSSIRPGTIGQGVSIDLNTMGESDRDITGKVRWQVEWKGEYLIGCMMNDEEDFERLCDLGGLTADGVPSIWSTVTDRVPEKYRRFILPATSWIAIFATSVLLGMSVPLFWQMTFDDAEAGDIRLTAVSLSERQAAADELLASTPHALDQAVAVQLVPKQVATVQQVPDQGATVQQVPGQQTSEDPPPFPDNAILPPKRTESQANDLASPTQEPNERPPINPGSEAPLPVTTQSSPPVQTGGAHHTEVSPEQVDTQTPSTSTHIARSTTPYSAEQAVSKPADAHGGNEPDATASTVDLKEASRQIQGLLSVIAGDKQTADESASSSEKATQTGGVPKRPVRLAQTPPSRNREHHVDERRAREAWELGGQLYRSNQYAKAAEAFRDAVRHDSRNALYRYLLAMSVYQQNQFEEADRILKLAILLERTRPIENWGSLLSRYQGRSRLWVEQNRSALRGIRPR